MDRRKDAVLSFLKARGQASLAEVAAHLELSKQGALRHLDPLLAEGLIARADEVHSRPGRPEHVFRLTEAAAEHFPHSHRQLATELVRFMGAEGLERFFAERAERTEAMLAAELAGLSFEQKVKRIGELSAANGHMTEVLDNGDGSYAIRHGNCPIADVAAETGHPCHREQAMYGRLLDAEIERTTWMANADAACTYVIKTKKAGREIHV